MTERRDSQGLEAEALLQALRADEDMPAAAKARVWRRLATSTEGAGPSRQVRKGMSPGSWAVVVLAAAAALLLASRAGVLGPLVAERGGEAAKYSKVEAAPAPVVAREDGRARAEAEASEAVPQDMAEATPAEPRRVRAERPAREAKARPEDRESAPAEPMEVAPAEAASSLAEEAEALGRAQAAIQGGRADAALEELAGYARRFPQGSLREEYEALRAIALCTAGRTREGRGEAQAFLRDRAASALADRVRGVCLAGQ